MPQGRGNYQLLGEIARGGMGVVLKGHDTDLGRDVAVKVLDGELAKRPEVVQRFVEEAQIGGQLQHPGIVPVYELGLMADERPYFTMKLVKGLTLAALLQQRRSPTDNRGRLLAIFESVCQTVAYAHSKGVLHRDLKPANIMVGAFGEVQVVDWGLAKVLSRGGVADEKRANQSLHTVIATVRSGPGSSGSDSLAGSVMGTPAYMAPEQAQGEIEQLDERADVFSLGAILCEILTGRPPYEATANEPLLMQAANGQLQPARARLEACEADAALVRLCLSCLMTARTARPSNAADVARRLHEFLASVEERARAAELSAAEARIKAGEERRRRKLTVALAATVIGALALVGGGVAWAARERSQRAVELARRVEQTRVVVDQAHGESIDLGQAGKPAEALASARRALSLAEAGDADSGLLERARKFVAKADSDLAAALRERELLARDDALRARLVDLRLAQIATIGNPKREQTLDAEFAAAFREYGADLEGEDVVPALARIRDRSIGAEVALALDDWGRLRRRVHGAKSEKAENLFVLAMDLDPDPLRARLREAIATDALPELLELAAPESLPKLEPGSIFVLCASLWELRQGQRRADVYRVLDQALRLYPGDYVLQSLAGTYYSDTGRYDDALACRATAVGLRPKDAGARLRLADTQYFLGRVVEVVAGGHAVLALDPRNAEALYDIGCAQIVLGEHVEALENLTRALELEEDAGRRSDLRVAQYLNGILERGELEAIVERESQPAVIGTLLYALVEHPDPSRRDPRFVLRILAERSAALQAARWPFVLEAIARVRLEDWAGALTAIERVYRIPQLLIVSPMAYEFVRSRIYSGLARDLEARACFERGVVAWEERTVDDPSAWERCDAQRWRREAEAALAK